MGIVTISDEIQKKLKNAANEMDIDVNDLANLYITEGLDEEENKLNDPEYLEFVRRTNKAWEQVDEGKVINITDKF